MNEFLQVGQQLLDLLDLLASHRKPKTRKAANQWIANIKAEIEKEKARQPSPR